MAKLRDNMNWGKCYDYCKNALPKLDIALNRSFSPLELQTDYVLLLENYPPSISLNFTPGIEGNSTHHDLFTEIQRQRLKENKSTILNILGNEATNLNLIVEPKGNGVEVERGYVFKPIYQNFRK